MEARQPTENSGRRVAGSTKIPVAEMAKQNLDKIFPFLTAEQVTALREGKPVPPSPDWVEFYAEHKTGLITAPSSDAQAARIQELNQKLADRNDLARENFRLEALLDAFAASQKAMSVVTAILVFSDPKRVRRARKAVNQFVAQTYPNKQLIIVNASDVAITNVQHHAVKELKWPDGGEPTTGAMRNYAVRHAAGDMLYPHWDDDDVYDRHLLAYMMQNFAGEARAVLLSSQIRVDIKNSVAYVHTEPAGIPNTMLVPKTGVPYPDVTGREDRMFWHENWGVTSKVIDNSKWPLNALKMCVFDGHNVLSADDFMVGHSDPDLYGKWELGASEAEHMKAVLSTFGLRAEPKLPEESKQLALA